MSINNMIKTVRDWLPFAQSKLESTAKELELQLTQADVQPLSKHTFLEVKNQLKQLTTPSPYRQQIASELTIALDRWHQGDTYQNSFILRYNPVEKIDHIFHETIVVWIPEQPISTEFLLNHDRPEQDHQILLKLKEKIEFIQNNKTNSEDKKLIIIPNLSQLFLRCVDGFLGLEYLQNQIFQHPSIFWLMGCNDWLWQYLSYVWGGVTNFEQTTFLPSLDALELNQWLEPVCQKIDFEFNLDVERDSNSEQNAENHENWSSKAERQYFESLAHNSAGISSVAAQLWLYSLHLSQVENPSEEKTSQTDKQLVTLLTQSPKLPYLTKEDHFLLYSLCLHEKISLPHLAMSLGESENQIITQVQKLLKADVIQRHQTLLHLNPAYYLRLRSNLRDNHFLVGDLNS